MNDTQQTFCDSVVRALSQTKACSLVLLSGELARDEGDDFSTVELCVIVDHTLAQDIVHTRDQWAARFGPMLSVQYPADSAWHNTLDILYDETMDSLHVRIALFEVDERDACVAYLAHSNERIVFHDPLFYWPGGSKTLWSDKQLRSRAEECLRTAWHRLPEIVRAWQRRQMPEAYLLYMQGLEDLATLIRIETQSYPIEKGVEDISVDCDDAHVRILTSLTDDIRSKKFDAVLSAYADALDDLGQQLNRSYDVLPPSKVVITTIRESCNV